MLRFVPALRHSLRGRLLLGTLAWVLASVLVAGWVLSDLFRQHTGRQLASELTVHMNQLVAALSVDPQGVASLQFEPTDPRLQQPLSGLYWQVDRLEPGQPPEDAVFHSRSLWDQVLHLPAALSASDYAGLEALAGPGDTRLLGLARVVTPPEGAAAYRLVVAADQTMLDQPMAQFRLMLAISLGLLAIGMTMAAIMQVLVGLRPLVYLRQGLAAVREGQQSQIGGRFPSEVQPLVDEFNQVLQNNSQIVQRARTQAGNLAHALKTPLSVLANGAAQEQTPFGHLVAEQVDLARRQVDHHLARARAAAAVQIPGKRTEALAVVQGLARVLTKLYANKSVQLVIDGVPDKLAFKGEHHDLQEMLGNLMENACKWCTQRVWVRAVLRDSTTIVFYIDDDGPGLPDSQQEQVFERGVRLDERTPGSGLGLSIVRDLALAYGGKVCAHRSDRGGLGVMLELPGGLNHEMASG